jgi:hypothetical protein
VLPPLAEATRMVAPCSARCYARVHSSP